VHQRRLAETRRYADIFLTDLFLSTAGDISY